MAVRRRLAYATGELRTVRYWLRLVTKLSRLTVTEVGIRGISCKGCVYQ